jgi:hypothetical protein
MSIADLFDPNAMMAAGPATAPAAPPVSQRGFMTPRTQRTMPEGLSPRAQALFQALSGNPELPQFSVISGFRDPRANAIARGARRSQHMQGNAMDIDVSRMTDDQKAALLRAATAAGARGIGIYPSGRSLHIDVRDTPAVWGMNPAGAYRGMSVDQAPQWARPILGDVLGQASMQTTGRAPMQAPQQAGDVRRVQTTSVAPGQAPTQQMAGAAPVLPAQFGELLAQQGTANAVSNALMLQQNQIAQRERDTQARRAALFGGVAGLYGG